MERIIRKATIADLPVVLRLIRSGREIMCENGNPNQWGDNHPTTSQLEDDIANGHSYLLTEGGRAIATFAFIPGPDITYAVIHDGQWINDERPYYVIHRVARLHGVHGVMTSILAYCFSRTGNIRIDTHRDNLPMQHALAHADFHYCGIIHLPNGDERLAFQRITPMTPANDEMNSDKATTPSV